MDRQFLFDNPKDQQKIIRIVGKDAIKYFQNMGLDKNALSDQATTLMADPEIADLGLNPQELSTPQFPVNIGGESVPKFTVENGGESGSLILEKDDLSGEYDYIPDVESMKLPNEQQETEIMRLAIDMVTGVDPKSGQPVGVNAMLQQEGIKVKVKDLIEDFFERLGMKDADKYFEKAPPPVQQGGLNGNEALPPGAGGPEGVPAFAGLSQDGGIQAGAQASA